jgi:hypothetical protein
MRMRECAAYRRMRSRSEVMSPPTSDRNPCGPGALQCRGRSYIKEPQVDQTQRFFAALTVVGLVGFVVALGWLLLST